MTQKELLYYEDAYTHEDNIIKILNDVLKNLNDADSRQFLENEINIHNNMKNGLINLLRENANG